MEIQVNQHWLTARTGDPFTDVGAKVIDFLTHYPPLKNKSILELIRYIAEIYVNNWNGKLHPFFLNSPITQAAYTEYEWQGERYSSKTIKQFNLSTDQLIEIKREDKKITKTIEYFEWISDEQNAHKHGYCEISGVKAALFAAGRHNQILAGSETFVNFHSNLQAATYLSKEMLIRMFFVPFGVRRLADKIALVTSNNEKILEFFVFQNCIQNLEAIHNDNSDAPLKSKFKNPANAIFRFVEDYLEHLKSSDELRPFEPSSVSLEFYHFSNLGQSPDVILHSMDNDVFQFYCYCQKFYKKEWQAFIQRHYSPDNYAKCIFNEAEQKWKTKEGEAISFQEYERWRNFVLNNLFNKISLTKILMKWSQSKAFPIQIIYFYQTIIRGMQKETLAKIEVIAALIAKESDEYIDDAINNLNGFMSRADLRKFFFRVQKLAFQRGAAEAMISADDYLEYLLPPGSAWTELRDLFVICVYQKRHNELINKNL